MLLAQCNMNIYRQIKKHRHFKSIAILKLWCTYRQLTYLHKKKNIHGSNRLWVCIYIYIYIYILCISFDSPCPGSELLCGYNMRWIWFCSLMLLWGLCVSPGNTEIPHHCPAHDRWTRYGLRDTCYYCWSSKSLKERDWSWRWPDTRRQTA